MTETLKLSVLRLLTINVFEFQHRHCGTCRVGGGPSSKIFRYSSEPLSLPTAIFRRNIKISENSATSKEMGGPWPSLPPGHDAPEFQCLCMHNVIYIYIYTYIHTYIYIRVPIKHFFLLFSCPTFDFCSFCVILNEYQNIARL